MYMGSNGNACLQSPISMDPARNLNGRTPDIYYDQTDYPALEFDRNYGKVMKSFEHIGGAAA